MAENQIPTVPTKEDAPSLAEPDLEPLAASDPHKHGAPHEDEAPGSEAWTTFVSVAENYDRNTCDIWKGEIDNLLLFASLFSAVATAFVVEAYKLLQVDHQEVASAVLFGIHQQLDNIIRQNITAPSLVSNPTPHFTPSKTAVAINICFFLSLTLSLSTVSVGILCLQWLREYRREPEVSPQQMIAIRYFRLRGIEKWRMKEIVGLLPVALQLALFIFLIGIGLLLWITHQTVFIVVCCAIATTILIYAITSIIPSIRAFLHIFSSPYSPNGDHSLCPYRSPQAWFLRRASLAAGMSIAYALEKLFNPTANGAGGNGTSLWNSIATQLKNRFDSKDWAGEDVRHISLLRSRNEAWTRTAVAWGIASIPAVHRHNVRALCAMIRCIEDMKSNQSVIVWERLDAEGDETLREAVDETWREGKDPELSEAERERGEMMARYMVLVSIIDLLASRSDNIRLLTLNYRFELFLRILNQFARGFTLADPRGSSDPVNGQVERKEARS
ncbi:hypothetical protein MD484_g4512, partial [Candolleomyces efflorescens]